MRTGADCLPVRDFSKRRWRFGCCSFAPEAYSIRQPFSEARAIKCVSREMVVKLHYSQTLDGLIEPLAANLREQQEKDPFTPIYLILPDTALPGKFGDPTFAYLATRRFVELRLADRLGIAANLRFSRLSEFFTDALERSNPTVHILRQHELTALVFECLRCPDALDSPEICAWRDEISAGVFDESELEGRIFEVSAKIARLFNSYAASRRAMVQEWSRRTNSADGASGEIRKRRQRALWTALFDADGSLKARFTADRNTRFLLLGEALHQVVQRSIELDLPSVLHLFCFCDFEPLLREALWILENCENLQIYALNPCQEFWEDIFSFDAPGAHDRESLERAALPLRYWARSSHDLVCAINQFTEYHFDWHTCEVQKNWPPTLLERLKADVLSRSYSVDVKDDVLHSSDESIRFFACPSVACEVQAVADAIWSLLCKNEFRTESERTGEAVRPHEIAVIFPDTQRDLYVPHIEGALSERYQIPVNVVNPPLGAQSRLVDAIERLLELPTGRFTCNEVLSLLTHPAIIGPETSADAEEWREWCRELGIVFGADMRDFADSYLPGDVLHWDQGLRRLALGAFMEGERSGEARFFLADDGSDYLPLQLYENEVDSAATLIRLARTLIGSATRLREAHLTLAEWAQIIGRFVKTFVAPKLAQDERAFECYLEAIDSIGCGALNVKPVSYDIARRLIRRRIAELEPDAGHLSFTGVVVGSLATLFSVPFKVVFLLGLNRDTFPTRERFDPDDLTYEDRLAVNRSLAERERSWFLQTLLNTRERVIFSYVCPPETKDSPPASSVLTELATILTGYVGEAGVSAMTVYYPERPYDPDFYFPHLRANTPEGPSSAVLTDPGRAVAAQIVILRESVEQACGANRAPVGPLALSLLPPHRRSEIAALLRLPLTVNKTPPSTADIANALPVRALVEFLKCPIQGRAKYVLGIEDEPVETPEEDEPVELSAILRAIIARDAFWQGKGSLPQAKRAYDKLLRIAQAKGEAPFGLLAEAQRKADLQILKGWHEAVKKLELENLSEWMDIRLGRADEYARIDQILPELDLDLSQLIRRPASDDSLARSNDGCVVKIYGRLARLSPGFDKSLNLVLRDRIEPTDFLEQLITALILRAAGRLESETFKAIVIGANEQGRASHKVVDFKCPAPEQALGYLANLVYDLIYSADFHFLPIEAALRIERERRRNSAECDGHWHMLVEELRQNQNALCSSDYGPLPKVRKRFAPPPEHQLLDLVERRFSLLMDALLERK